MRPSRSIAGRRSNPVSLTTPTRTPRSLRACSVGRVSGNASHDRPPTVSSYSRSLRPGASRSQPAAGRARSTPRGAGRWTGPGPWPAPRRCRCGPAPAARPGAPPPGPARPRRAWPPPGAAVSRRCRCSRISVSPASNRTASNRPNTAPSLRAARGAATANRRRGRTTRRAAPAPRPRRRRPAAAAQPGRRDHEHDALGRGDHLAPVPRRQRGPHPGQHPARHHERVPHRSDGEHPRRRRGASTYTLNTRMRNASTSMSKRAPNAETVPVRRAT